MHPATAIRHSIRQALGSPPSRSLNAITIAPRLFLYGKKTTADAGITYTTEDRTGGSMNYIKNGGNGFFEKNNTGRISTQAGIAHRLSEHASIQFKNSYSRFARVITIPTYTFDALQQSSFSEFTWSRQADKADWVIGANLLTEDLDEKQQSADPQRDYHHNTYGLFVQNALSVTDRFILESGLRGDYVKDYGFVLLPRYPAMLKISPDITTRGGLGYKTPTIFTEDAERIQFRNLLPINITQSAE